jgi:hypothetical protein
VKQKRLGLVSAALGALVVISTPVSAATRCKVMDPTGTPLNARDESKKIIGKIENGRIVMVARDGKDDAGKAWAYVTTPSGQPIGWV